MDEEIDKILDEVDKDGNGEIDYQVRGWGAGGQVWSRSSLPAIAPRRAVNQASAPPLHLCDAGPLTPAAARPPTRLAQEFCDMMLKQSEVQNAVINRGMSKKKTGLRAGVNSYKALQALG